MKTLLSGACALLLLTLAARVAAGEEAVVKPLFPVTLEHGFPQAGKSFEEVRELILKHYYTQDISEDALYWAAIQGMLRYVSPPENPDLAKIWTVEQYDKVRNALEGNQISIGIKSSFNPEDGSLTVTRVLPESPAVGVLEPLDRILRINGQPLKGRPVDEVSALMNGDENTSVALTVNRDINVFEATLKRAKFAEHNVVVTPLTKAVALVELKRLSLDVAKELKTALDKLAKDEVKGLVIDLRDNPGGVFLEGLRVVELFLPAKSVMLRTYNREDKLRSYVSANPEPFKFKLMFLVNPNTASAAEIIPGALRDHKLASIVGVRTYGKGVFETTYTLENQYRVKFITGAMYTPLGRAWQGKGLVPDFFVEQDEKTLAALSRLAPLDRYAKDVAMITAVKLLTTEY